MTFCVSDIACGHRRSPHRQRVMTIAIATTMSFCSAWRPQMRQSFSHVSHADCEEEVTCSVAAWRLSFSLLRQQAAGKAVLQSRR